MIGAAFIASTELGIVTWLVLAAHEIPQELGDFGILIHGLDPAAAPLALARSRGIRVVRGVGEHLPFRTGVFGAVLIVVTVCFADDPAALLAEARRVVRHDGAVVLGEVFAESPWGRFYQHQAAHGHPFYSAAHFLTRDQTLAMATGAGLGLVHYAGSGADHPVVRGADRAHPRCELSRQPCDPTGSSGNPEVDWTCPGKQPGGAGSGERCGWR